MPTLAYDLLMDKQQSYIIFLIYKNALQNLLECFLYFYTETCTEMSNVPYIRHFCTLDLKDQNVLGFGLVAPLSTRHEIGKCRVYLGSDADKSEDTPANLLIDHNRRYGVAYNIRPVSIQQTVTTAFTTNTLFQSI